MRERPIVLLAARPVVRRLVTAALDPAGFRVASPGDGDVLPDSVAELRPDVVVVEADAEMPKRMAIAHPPAGRVGAVPVIVLGTDTAPQSAMQALDAGADDYIVRPFDPMELAARVPSLVRRRGSRLASGRRNVGRATVDLGRRTVTVDDGVARLARSEWRLLVRLLAEPDVVVPYEALAIAAFGWEARGDRSALRDAIRRLRRKLGMRTGETGPIQTHRGFGYSLSTKDAARRR